MITRMALALACFQCTACGDGWAERGSAPERPRLEAYAMTEGEGQTVEAEAIRKRSEQWPPGMPEPVATYDGNALASWYGPEYTDRLTASGEVFDPHGMTAASVSLPLGTVLEVCRSTEPTWPYGVRCVRVVVNDRMPTHTDPDRRLDLSYEAARRLGMVEQGIAYVYYRRIE